MSSKRPSMAAMSPIGDVTMPITSPEYDSLANTVKNAIKTSGNISRLVENECSKDPLEDVALTQCLWCSRKAMSEAHLIRHMMSHTGDEVMSCTYCPANFTHFKKLQDHLFGHQSPQTVQQCKICKEKFKMKDNIRKHILKEHIQVLLFHNPPYKCIPCNSPFFQERLLKKHMKKHVEVVSNKKERQQVQDKEKKQKIGHPLECVICSQKFTGVSELIIHTIHHTDEQPYQCCVCQEGFINIGKLLSHMRVHIGNTQPFNCLCCYKTFEMKATFLTHLRKHHVRIATGLNQVFTIEDTHWYASPIQHKEIVSCPVCNDQIESRKEFYIHLLFHRDLLKNKPKKKKKKVKLIGCPVCDKRYHPIGLKHHLKSHSDIFNNDKDTSQSQIGRCEKNSSTFSKVFNSQSKETMSGEYSESSISQIHTNVENTKQLLDQPLTENHCLIKQGENCDSSNIGKIVNQLGTPNDTREDFISLTNFHTEQHNEVKEKKNVVEHLNCAINTNVDSIQPDIKSQKSNNSKKSFTKTDSIPKVEVQTKKIKGTSCMQQNAMKTAEAEINSFICSLCNEEFTKRIFLIKHFLSHELYRDLKYTLLKRWNIYSINKPRPRHSCPYCSQSLATLTGYNKHINMIHPERVMVGIDPPNLSALQDHNYMITKANLSAFKDHSYSTIAESGSMKTVRKRGHDKAVKGRTKYSKTNNKPSAIAKISDHVYLSSSTSMEYAKPSHQSPVGIRMLNYLGVESLNTTITRTVRDNEGTFNYDYPFAAYKNIDALPSTSIIKDEDIKQEEEVMEMLDVKVEDGIVEFGLNVENEHLSDNKGIKIENGTNDVKIKEEADAEYQYVFCEAGICY